MTWINVIRTYRKLQDVISDQAALAQLRTAVVENQGDTAASIAAQLKVNADEGTGAILDEFVSLTGPLSRGTGLVELATELQAEAGRIESRVEETKTNYARLEEENASYKNDIEELQKVNDSLISQIDQLTKVYDALKVQITTLGEKI